MLSKILTAKVVAAATVAAFGIGTAAAAANGSLPGQTGAANGHAKAGLAVAASHTASGAHHAGHAKDHTGSNTTGSNSPASVPATGPANSHAQFGLCQAFLAGQKSSSPGSSTTNPPQYDSTAFQALMAQHGGVAATTTYCNGVVTTHGSTPAASGDSTPAVKPGNSGKPADTHRPAVTTGRPALTTGRPPVTTGKPATTPASTRGNAPVSTPNQGGTSTANTASHGASSAGTSTADTASHGASSAGAGNASKHH